MIYILFLVLQAEVQNDLPEVRTMSHSSCGICATVTRLANQQENASVDSSCVSTARHMERNNTKDECLFYLFIFSQNCYRHEV